MKINSADVTLCHYSDHLSAQLSANPLAAVRSGVLGLVHDALLTRTPWLADALTDGATELLAALGIATVYEVPAALTGRPGRPAARLLQAVRHPDLVRALGDGLAQLRCDYGLDPGPLERVGRWGPSSGDPGAVVALLADDRAARGDLAERLRVRALEILGLWRAGGIQLEPGMPRMDGRTLAVASRVWQVPLVDGEMAPEPTAAAALYANRLGRSAAAVAFARLNGALRSAAPDVAVTEPLALLVAVGESICSAWMGVEECKVARAGGLPVRVRSGEPLSAAFVAVPDWWPVFSAWGSSERRAAVGIPTAWKLSSVEADVLVWVLCEVAAMLAVAASAVPVAGRGLAPLDWRGHVAARAPQWDAGAASVWALMQRGRKPHVRTERPVGGLPALADVAAWPWRPV